MCVFTYRHTFVGVSCKEIFSLIFLYWWLSSFQIILFLTWYTKMCWNSLVTCSDLEMNQVNNFSATSQSINQLEWIHYECVYAFPKTFLIVFFTHLYDLIKYWILVGCISINVTDTLTVHILSFNKPTAQYQKQ